MLSVVMLSIIMLSVVMLSVIMLSVVMLSVVMLSVIILSSIILSVVMLNVVTPVKWRVDRMTWQALNGCVFQVLMGPMLWHIQKLISVILLGKNFKQCLRGGSREFLQKLIKLVALVSML